MASSSEYPYRAPSSVHALLDMIKSTQRQLADLRSNLLKMAGIHAEPGKIIIAGDLEVVGGIKNDQLAHPTAMGSSWNRAGGFAVPASWTDLTSCQIVVPEGFDHMQFHAVATVNARNDGPSTQYLIGHIRREDGVSTYGSVTARTTLPTGYWGTVVLAYAWGEAVVPGATHTFTVEGWSGGFGANVDNEARIEVTATFTRA